MLKLNGVKIVILVIAVPLSLFALITMNCNNIILTWISSIVYTLLVGCLILAGLFVDARHNNKSKMNRYKGHLIMTLTVIIVNCILSAGCDALLNFNINIPLGIFIAVAMFALGYMLTGVFMFLMEMINAYIYIKMYKDQEDNKDEES